MSSDRTRTVESVLARADVGDCWVWTGSRTHRGYGQVKFNGKVWAVHRLIWEELVGPIGDGLEIDHLCRNPPCVNPDHLEPVTHRVNILRSFGVAAKNARATACSQGHPLTPENLRSSKSGRRQCRACHQIRHRAYMRKRRLEASTNASGDES